MKSLLKSRLPSLSMWLVFVPLWPTSVHPQQHPQDITCENGSGEFSTRFSTGVTVSVGPLRKGAFAERACAATLVWNGQELPVASDVAQVGIDVLGADLGFGVPVVAFQIDNSGTGAHRTYQIYSLAKPPRLLYRMMGGNSYRAADTDLDGQVEVWTNDAAAVDGFERVPGADFDFAPTVVLRFQNGNPVDVGSQFRTYYDTQISKLRSQLNPDDLADFKQSDGTLSAKISGDKLHRRIRTKITILEVVWAYLYSGHEQEAWSALSGMWPSGDLERIRGAISAVHERGILHNVDRTRRPSSRRGQAKIFDAIGTSSVVENHYVPNGGALQAESPVVQPQSILLRSPPAPEGEHISSTEMLELVVDAAGKVHSAKVVNGMNDPLVEASAGWQFIPAFQDGRPIACRFRISLWKLQ